MTEAYRILRNRKKRAEYDILFQSHNKQEWFEISVARELGVDEKDALSEMQTLTQEY